MEKVITTEPLPLFVETEQFIENAKMPHFLGFNPETTHTYIIQSAQPKELTTMMRDFFEKYGHSAEQVSFDHIEASQQCNEFNKLQGYIYKFHISITGYNSKSAQGEIVTHVYNEYRPGIISKEIPKLFIEKYAATPAIDGENLRVELHSENVDTIYTLEEVLKLTGITDEVLGFTPSTGAPDTRRYILNINRKL